MPIPVDQIRHTETPLAVHQESSSRAASGAGVGETPSSLWCFTADANSSIFSRVWDAISSFFASLFAWVTCSESVPSSVPSPGPEVLSQSPFAPRAPHELQLEDNIEKTAELLLQAGLKGKDPHKTKCLFVLRKEGEVIGALPINGVSERGISHIRTYGLKSEPDTLIKMVLVVVSGQQEEESEIPVVGEKQPLLSMEFFVCNATASSPRLSTPVQTIDICGIRDGLEPVIGKLMGPCGANTVHWMSLVNETTWDAAPLKDGEVKQFVLDWLFEISPYYTGVMT